MRLTSVSAKKNIGGVIRERRVAMKMTQGELAGKAQLTQTFLSLVEHGNRAPSCEVLNRLAAALGEDASLLEQEAGNADTDTVVRLNHHLRRLIGSANKKKLRRLLEFIETLG
jgi:transcriptional regulator with XRE-family HTH domain